MRHLQPLSHPAYCRDCLGPVRAALQSAPHRCEACGSHQVIAHAALDTFTIAHLDCDAFFASIEKRDNPSLRTQPVIVGGGRRGVVATACYQARLSGVRSAMPMFKALKLCPDAVVVKPRMDVYAAVGKEIRLRMQALTPLVEPASLDEAFMDLSGTNALHRASPALSLIRLQKAIEVDLGLTVSIGLSVNKLLAKLASELDKPRGFAVISAEEGRAVLAGRRIDALHGVGPAQATRLAAKGFTTIAQLQAMSQAEAIVRLGEGGLRLSRLANGLDDRAVEPESPTRAISAETTFENDIRDHDPLIDRLLPLAERVAARAKAKGLAGRVVTLKLKTSGFETLTRRQVLDHPTQLAREIWQTARQCLARIAPGPAYRLIGVGISDLTAEQGDAADLLDPSRARWARAERATDALKARFGEKAIATGRALRLDAQRTATHTAPRTPRASGAHSDKDHDHEPS